MGKQEQRRGLRCVLWPLSRAQFYVLLVVQRQQLQQRWGTFPGLPLSRQDGGTLNDGQSIGGGRVLGWGGANKAEGHNVVYGLLEKTIDTSLASHHSDGGKRRGALPICPSMQQDNGVLDDGRNTRGRGEQLQTRTKKRAMMCFVASLMSAILCPPCPTKEAMASKKRGNFRGYCHCNKMTVH
jgi:hypothetical protein